MQLESIAFEHSAIPLTWVSDYRSFKPILVFLSDRFRQISLCQTVQIVCNVYKQTTIVGKELNGQYYY